MMINNHQISLKIKISLIFFFNEQLSLFYLIIIFLFFKSKGKKYLQNFNLKETL